MQFKELRIGDKILYIRQIGPQIAFGREYDGQKLVYEGYYRNYNQRWLRISL